MKIDYRHRMNGTTRSRGILGSRSGFTLVEMILVMVILAALAAVVVPKFAGRSKQAKETQARSQITNMELAIDSYEVDMGEFPRSGNNLQELINPPTGNNANAWQGPYLKKGGIPTDPWGNEYVYVFPGKNNLGSYDLYSSGPDGKAGSEDDITNWLDPDRN